MFITDSQLLSYQRCSRKVFLDTYGDFTQQDSPNDFLLKLIKDSSEFRSSIIKNYIYQKPDYPRGDLIAGGKATEVLMAAGIDVIYQGILIIQQSSINSFSQNQTINLVSHPVLLIKQPGYSRFGDWVYIPTDIKLSKRPKLEYQIVATFHAQILASIQGVWPEAAWLILRKKGLYKVNLEKRIEQMQETISELISMLQNRLEPEVFMTRQKCSICTWYSSCHTVAETQKHLSLLPGVTPNRYAVLKSLDLITLESLSSANPNDLEVYPEFADGVGTQVVQQAQSVWENQVIIRNEKLTEEIDSKTLPINYYKLTRIVNAPVEIYFDIEAQPDINLDYLHGVLVVDKRTNTEKFYVNLAENPLDEEFIWYQFLNLVWKYPIAPIYHFCEYEIQTVKKLAKLYNTPDYLWKPLLKRFVDIHKVVTQTVILPVESYSLKNIARWLGFEWRNPEANGAQSVCWYEEWLKTGDRSFLDAIIIYNQDDCYATYYIKEWLLKFLEEGVRRTESGGPSQELDIGTVG
ncbi:MULTISPECIES: TM0106 family RecB-like putative nuclease [Okeania]|uniref:TM0106 family RecB-like putative nuclease n=3 Tax=Okeania TaxID=1458928 RepID=A0A3N6NRR3_9CYAN|nr:MULTISPECIES: TM0106 family RecB-like putative nuclease [Okeania]NES74571.1 TM0106 family RecB-like putative nuclease [Okeania sp. SIO1H4]NET18642.1 TM0106 family RecB-like putative nuclease [Okeania sp. SIO1H5]NET74750.1 TM0106 family RecB-like putative nuclease [Okeania sp. SIO1F9]NET92290.1 TM0106 family RecB-like putative nuclease [Okeania sp. SIO1H2]RQH18492.1 TM0106 family RecB-like putative nuclease [Okeania hirsuta]